MAPLASPSTSAITAAPAPAASAPTAKAAAQSSSTGAAAGGSSTVLSVKAPSTTSSSSSAHSASYDSKHANDPKINMEEYAYNKIFVGGLHYDTRDGKSSCLNLT
jgi:hypothetical protein